MEPVAQNMGSPSSSERLRRGLGEAGKGLGETRTDALLPQPETGKIGCVHRLPCARLTPGVCRSNAAIGALVPRRADQWDRTRTGIDFAAGTLLPSAWCQSGNKGLHSG